MKRITIMSTLLVVLLLSVSGLASAGDNGGEGPGTLDPPITVDAGWYKTTEVPPSFTWFGSVPAGPFTFDWPVPVILSITDDFCAGDQFEVFDSNVSIGFTSAVPSGPCIELGPEAAFADPSYSSGTFPLSPGPHSITIIAVVNPFNVGRGYIKVDSVGTPVIAAEIDIKPGSDPNSINCQNENEMIAVSVLTTAGFDAADVDHGTVVFAGAAESHTDMNSGEPVRHEEDIDDDGDIDLVFHFRFGETTLTCDALEATLTGATGDGIAVEGTDAVRMLDTS